MVTIECAKIWGGINSANEEIQAKGVFASLTSQAHMGKQGGDIYYLSVCGKGLITRIAIADVTGHGEKATQVSKWIYKGLLDNMNMPEGKAVLECVNNIAFSEGARGITTASIFTVNQVNSTLSFSIAGHLPFFFKKKEENNWQELSLKKHTPKGNIPLGIFENTFYDEESIEINTGDRIFIYTDGLIEAANQNMDLFGRKSLLKTLNSNSSQNLSDLKHSIALALEKHLGGTSVQDDLTLMTVEFITK
jgi:phosphoserine phosphatase RsbU/P